MYKNNSHNMAYDTKEKNILNQIKENSDIMMNVNKSWEKQLACNLSRIIS